MDRYGQVLCVYELQLCPGPERKTLTSYLDRTGFVNKGFIVRRYLDHFLAEDGGFPQAGKIASFCLRG